MNNLNHVLIRYSGVLKILVFLAFGAVMVFYAIPSYNSKIAKSESFSGIVVRKYQRRGNSFDILLFNGKIHTVPFQIKQKDFQSIEVGDTVEMIDGEFVNSAKN